MADSRIARHTAVATALSLLSNHQLTRMLDRAPVVAEGIGGTAVRLEVAGVPVFAKRVPLTELERRGENFRSTANVFELPPYCHYGLGSAGGGVWRELAVHVMTTGWVLSGECAHFPLLHHWRELPMARRASDPGEREKSVAFWHGSAAVRRRLEELDGATTSLVLCSEYLPTTVHDWLRDHLSDAERIEEQLLAMADFLERQGLLHFDAHFGNILADSDRIYLTDFGLALSTRFDLSPQEQEFAARNIGHDRAYLRTHLVNWLVTELAGTTDRAERTAYLQRVAQPVQRARSSESPHDARSVRRPRNSIDLPEPAASIVSRHVGTAVRMNDFYRRLAEESRATPFPAEEFSRLRD